jgi:hypothetical protein
MLTLERPVLTKTRRRKPKGNLVVTLNPTIGDNNDQRTNKKTTTTDERIYGSNEGRKERGFNFS